jgi:hypothetical protein
MAPEWKPFKINLRDSTDAVPVRIGCHERDDLRLLSSYFDIDIPLLIRYSVQMFLSHSCVEESVKSAKRKSVENSRLGWKLHAKKSLWEGGADEVPEGANL